MVPKKVIEHYSYQLNDQIGSGYSSKVFQGKDERSGEIVAVKVLDMKMITNEVQLFLLRNEIAVMKKFDNYNILKLYDVFQTANNTYIITEFCNHGDLRSLIQKYGTLSESAAQKILRHIVNGFREMVKKKVIHRDIKPANILVKDGVPKLADFGFSKDNEAAPCKYYYNVGTPMYMCPQALKKNEYSYKSDIWSLGVLYYELLFGVTPWQANTEKELGDKISNVAVSFPTNIKVSEESKDFIRRCLTVDENRRLSPQEMENHPLLKMNFKTGEAGGSQQQSQQQQQQQQVQQNQQRQQPPSQNQQYYAQSQKTPQPQHVQQQSIQQTPNNQQRNGPQQQQQQQSQQQQQQQYVNNQEQGAHGYVPQHTPHQHIHVTKITGESGSAFVNGKENSNQAMAQNYANSNGMHYDEVLRNKNINEVDDKKYDLPQNQRKSNYQNQNKAEYDNRYNDDKYKAQPYPNPNPKDSNAGNKYNYSNSFATTQVTNTPNMNLPSNNLNSYNNNQQYYKEDFQYNDHIILAQINFCRFLIRLSKLTEEFCILDTPYLRDRILFFILKNVMVKITKLKEMCDKSINNFALREFIQYSRSESFGKFQIVIKEYYQKYSGIFDHHWQHLFNHKGLRDELQSEKRFEAVFDLSFIELESFYIILQTFLRYAIQEMNTLLNQRLHNEPENLGPKLEGQIVLLDYLVTYFQLASLILDKFQDYAYFAQSSKIEQIAEGRPVRLTKSHFMQIRNKIMSLELV